MVIKIEAVVLAGLSFRTRKHRASVTSPKMSFHSITDRLWNAAIHFDGKPVYLPISETPAAKCAHGIKFRIAESTPNRSISNRDYSPCRGNLLHVEVSPDDEVARVSRAELFLEHIGCGIELAGADQKKLVA